MKNLFILTLFIAISLFLIACNNATPPDQVSQTQQPYANDQITDEALPEDSEPWAKDNFDLQRIGPLLERSRSPEEFERYLNEDDGINNLDFNGDGYADYISVDEFGDEGYDGQRGLSLYSRFGPDLIQEIASIFLYRDQPNYPGARVLVYGNEQIYGDNQYYETNWLDRSLQIANVLFSDRDDYYRSPYYYDNYPSYYDVYEVVETPVYRTRIERLYPEPVFVFTSSPQYIDRIKIKSPNNGLHLGQIYAKMAKPTKEQREFREKNPGKPAKAAKPERGNNGERGGDRPGKSGNAPGRSDESPGQMKKQAAENPVRGNPGGPPKADKPNDKPQGGKPNDKPQKAEKGGGQAKGQGQGKGKGKP